MMGKPGSLSTCSFQGGRKIQLVGYPGTAKVPVFQIGFESAWQGRGQGSKEGWDGGASLPILRREEGVGGRMWLAAGLMRTAERSMSEEGQGCIEKRPMESEPKVRPMEMLQNGRTWVWERTLEKQPMWRSMTARKGPNCGGRL